MRPFELQHVVEAAREAGRRSWLLCTLDKHHEAAPGPLPSLTCVRCGCLMTAPARGMWPRRLSMWSREMERHRDCPDSPCPGHFPYCEALEGE